LPDNERIDQRFFAPLRMTMPFNNALTRCNQ
jgi:hypothetical protein